MGLAFSKVFQYLQFTKETRILMLGLECARPRALLFKLLCDDAAVPCELRRSPATPPTDGDAPAAHRAHADDDLVSVSVSVVGEGLCDVDLVDAPGQLTTNGGNDDAGAASSPWSGAAAALAADWKEADGD